MEDVDIKSLFKNVVRQIHPDLFATYPFERARNSESLKRLNVYIESLSNGFEGSNETTELEFFVKREEGTFSRIVATLESKGSLAPLFLSFGLITPEQAEWVELKQKSTGRDDGVSLIDWLQEVLTEAAMASRQYDEMKKGNNDMRDSLEELYGIDSIDLGGESYVTSNLQHRHRECLENFSAVLSERVWEGDSPLHGLSVRLYHPDTVPAVKSGIQDADGTFRMRNVLMESHVGENGMVHLVAGVEQLRRALDRLDFDRAKIFSRVEKYWCRRSRELADELKCVLGVANIWYNSLSPGELQDFVIWAGETLQYFRSCGINSSYTYSFSIVVQSPKDDFVGSPLDHIPASKILTVRTDCPPDVLLTFINSDEAINAHITSNNVDSDDSLEEESLQLACEALGAKRLIRICSSYEQGNVLAACARLLEVADQIRGGLDLSNISLAIDDRYDVWDSGIISIPYDFKVSDIQPKLKALMSNDFEPYDQRVTRTRLQCLPTLHRGRAYPMVCQRRVKQSRLNLFHVQHKIKVLFTDRMLSSTVM
ncbi:hypothetical protein M9434_002948 [Picochlorum sp. BPE23]|nr:hypothetical protein M9434_002948 [Picochlorum sp. BPE23]